MARNTEPPQGVLRRYRVKLYGNVAQMVALEAHRRMHCALYNAAVQERNDAYRLAGKSLSHFDQSKAIKEIRADDPAYAAMAADGMSFTLARVDRAFQAFFRRAKSGAGAKSGHPRFKRVQDYPGFTLRPGHGWRFDLKPGQRSGRTYIKGVPDLVKWRGKFPSFPYAIKTGDVTLVAGEWFLSIVVDTPARMRREEEHSGEVSFDLIDSFARVRRVDGGHSAGPEETVHAAADGRITPVFARCPGDQSTVSGAYEEAPAGTPRTQGDSGRARVRAVTHHPAGTPRTQGDSGSRVGSRPPGRPAGTPRTQGDSGSNHASAGTMMPAGTPRTQGDSGLRDHVLAGIEPAGTPRTQGDSGADRHPLYPGDPAGTPRTQGDSGVVVHDAAEGLPPGTPRTRGSCKDRAIRHGRNRLKSRIARRRREALHVWTTNLARRFAFITIKTPPLREATKSGRGDERSWGAMTRFKAELNRHVLEQAPGMAIQMLEYKLTERAGGTEVVLLPSADVMAGNVIVEAKKSNRKLKRTANASRPG